MKETANPTSWRLPVYWIATIAVAMAFVATGLGNLFHFDHIAHDMQLLGYPVYFMTLLGLWKVLGALTIVIPGLPRLKEWAYAGILFDLTGAAFSRAASGHGLSMVAIPMVIACVAMLSWQLRPIQRRLPAEV
jgi:uncharacterized membrane protein YphA (DoxX/SURF4 family)